MNAQVLLCLVKTVVMASILAMCITSTEPRFEDGVLHLMTLLMGLYLMGSWAVAIDDWITARDQAKQDYWFSELEDDITNRMQHLTKE